VPPVGWAGAPFSPSSTIEAAPKRPNKSLKATTNEGASAQDQSCELVKWYVMIPNRWLWTSFGRFTSQSALIEQTLRRVRIDLRHSGKDSSD
jgi:hypothetical protein